MKDFGINNFFLPKYLMKFIYTSALKQFSKQKVDIKLLC